jgi:hypothetical protein
VASPYILLHSNRKINPAPLTRHTRINRPDFTIPNFSQPNQESPLRSLQKQQNSIKWTSIYKGRMSYKWKQFATARVRSRQLELRAQEWGPKFVTSMWDHSLQILKVRNDAFHADTHAQVNLRFRHTELKPLPHLFKKKYFDSQDTANRL